MVGIPLANAPRSALFCGVIVIRRLTDRHRAYTAIFLKGEPPKIFPTSDYEHARILQIYLQDRPYDGIHNDYTEFNFAEATAPGTASEAERPSAANDAGEPS